jgi:heat shock protein HslJ
MKKNAMINLLILWLVFILFLAACSNETPIAQQPLPEQPEATPTPETSVPTEILPEATPEPEPTMTPTPEVSQPVSRWNAVSEEGNWVLIGYGDALNPTVVQPGTYVTINFNDAEGQVGGSGGCNNFFTSFTADDDGNLTLASPIGSTLMACETGMEQEGLYLGALEKVTGYSVNEKGHLLLDYDSGTVYDEQLVFIPEAPFNGTIWILTAYGQPQNLISSKPGVITTAIFSSAGTVTGSTGCNNYLAGYTVQGDQIMIDIPNTNLAACGTGTDQEQAFMQLFDAAQSYRLGVDSLEITTSDGQVLRFRTQQIPLENVRWQLTAIDGVDISDNVTANMIFTPGDSPVTQSGENSVNGTAGCNTFFGPYTVTGDTLSAGPLGSTQKMCDETTMQVEQAFLAGLDGAKSFEIFFDQLTINTNSGFLTFVADRFPLEGTRWILTGSGPIDNPQPPVQGTSFIARFNRQFGMPSGINEGETGCNKYTATYYAHGSEIKVNLPQTSQNTCSDGQMEAEQGYFLGLNAARDFRILGNELYIYYDGSMLTFFGDYAAANVGPLAPLNDTFWRLTEINQTTVLPESDVNITFSINLDGRTGTLRGSGGCNSYNAEITDVFKLGPVYNSSDQCDTPEGVMQQESMYLDDLQTANGIFVEGSRLRITTNTGTLYYISSRPEVVPPTPTPTPAALSAAIVAPSNEYEGATVTFDASLSTPEDGIVSYDWWFTGDETANGVSITRTYDKTGAYDAILTVTDSTGQKAEASVKVRIHKYLIGPTWISNDGVITIKFGDGTLSGNAGCNDYSAAYTAETGPGTTNTITVETIAATGKVCDDDTMEREQIFLENLETAKNYTISINNITITGENGLIIFKGYTP